MLVKTLQALERQGVSKVLCDGQITTTRLLTAADGLGFSLSDVHPSGGTDTKLWYKHHWEANYIAAGDGMLENEATGETWPLHPGVLYMVGPKDRHRVRTAGGMHVISIFNPPLHGDEAHDADGAYEPSGEVPEGLGTLFVRSTEEFRQAGKEKVVAGGSARTSRLLVKADKLGFSFSDVYLAAGNENVLWYKHHWEANYVLEGDGEVVDLGSDESWPLAPGVLYIVGPKDRHSMRARTDLHLVSVFNPPIVGDEMHDAEGTIPASGPLPPGPPGA